MPVDSITLFDGESTHRLSRLMKATRTFARALESDLPTRFDFSEPSGRDLQITGQFSFNDTGELAQKITIALK